MAVLILTGVVLGSWFGSTMVKKFLLLMTNMRRFGFILKPKRFESQNAIRPNKFHIIFKQKIYD